MSKFDKYLFQSHVMMFMIGMTVAPNITRKFAELTSTKIAEK